MESPDITIRRADEVDVSSIVDLNHALFQEDAGQRDPFMNLNWPLEEGYEHFSRLVRDKTSIGLLAEVEGKTIGYLVGYVRHDSSLRPVKMAELESMYVKEAYRGQGVGQRLTRRFLAWAKEQGVERVSVTAYVANDRAIAFYRKLGFVPRNLTLELGL